MKYFFFPPTRGLKYFSDVLVHIYLGYYIVENIICIPMIHEWPQS